MAADDRGPLYGDKVYPLRLWNRIWLRFFLAGLSSQRELVGYQIGSFGVWIDAHVKLIEALRGEVETNAAIDRIVSGNALPRSTRNKNGWLESVTAGMLAASS